MSQHPSLGRFREEPMLGGRFEYTEASITRDVMALVAVVQEQQNAIRELRWCVAALLDSLEARGQLRLVGGLPTRDRYDEQGL